MRKEIIMFERTRSGFRGFVASFGSAVAAAAAVDQGRQPDAHDLRALGIDPVKFRAIRRS